jgi:tetratricopeptide (TPR) repeat protein
MPENILFPGYISREEEQQIRREASLVREHGKSRVVLLYGPGGVGKTRLVREMAATNAADTRMIWVPPIDLDDPGYWLLSNLERHVADRLDPHHEHFGPYLDYLSRLPSYTKPRVGHETVVSHLGRIKRVFLDCYKNFLAGKGTKVVIAFDTVETIRGMYLLLTLTQWMKALPDTLFILSGRSLPDSTTEQDPIQRELQSSPYQPIPVTVVRLGDFTEEAAQTYLNKSRIAAGLTDDEKSKLVRLTRGHPLWLAFTISYLDEKGMPEETAGSLADIERDIPYQGEVTSARGRALQEAFKRRLVTPYREVDFWHETVKRLAVMRQSVNQSIWQQLMADRPFPEDAPTLEAAWERLLQTPWIRPRANRRYVTLHDAVAEELAQRIIPLHDPNKQWRLGLWRRAVDIYNRVTETAEAELSDALTASDERLAALDHSRQLQDEGRSPSGEERAFVRDAIELDGRRRELDQLVVARLYYQLLSDFAEGCRQFLALFAQARKEHSVLFLDLLALEMDLFLPGQDHPYAFGDVIGIAIDEFREWLVSANPALHLQIGLSMADYLIRNEQPESAVELLDRLPEGGADHEQRYRLHNLRGNAYMRIPGRVKRGLPEFARALDAAAAVSSPDGRMLIAEAHKELGFYYRNEGRWPLADQSYQQARDAISIMLSTRGSDDDREEMASIQTHWAYVKGLAGSYRDGSNLVESAIAVRHRLKKHHEEGTSWSVCGEVYRYERRFHKAWEAYAEAERIFQGSRNWPWLGLIYQEQAICLFQAREDGVDLTPGKDSVEQAKRLITLALDICRDQAVRAYPSALNRAGRIFGQEDVEAGLRYLADGIEWARNLSDGWFWFANLIEYVELCYRAWVLTGRREHRDDIAGHKAEIRLVMEEYEFPDLRGRWELVNGHLAIHDALETEDDSRLRTALEHYKEGFTLIAKGYVGSSGASAVPGQFKIFGELFSRLPAATQAEWQNELRRAWERLERGSTLLLARLEELY